MNELLNHYELNKLLKEILYNSFSFIKSISLTKSNKNKEKSNKDNIDIKKEKEMYEKYLTYIYSKLDNYLDAR
jgi:hypothetical protein